MMRAAATITTKSTRRLSTKGPSVPTAARICGAYSDSPIVNGGGGISSLPLHETDASWFGRLRRDDDDTAEGTARSPSRHTARSHTRAHSTFHPIHNHHHHLLWTPSNATLQKRGYSPTPQVERAPAVAVMALGSVALVAKAGQYAVQGYNQWKEDRPDTPEDNGGDEATKGDKTPKGDTADGKGDTAAKDNTTKDKRQTAAGPRQNVFEKYFNLGVGSKYYEGGFEDKMTRREAALVLGVRESSTPKRIKEAHRKLLILNHPDTGGSTYLAGKLNEAKDLLLKGKRG